jgi:hypothetical protein
MKLQMSELSSDVFTASEHTSWRILKYKSSKYLFLHLEGHRALVVFEGASSRRQIHD